MNSPPRFLLLLLIFGYLSASETPKKTSIEVKKEDAVVEQQFLQFIPIAGNTFRLGDVFNEGDFDEQPISYVTLGDFAMSKYEVTVGQFERFVSETNYITDAEKEGWAYVWDGAAWSKDDGASFRKPGFFQVESHPVVCVSWNDAAAFCAWLSERSKSTVRLPTEAEWEFAARERGMRPRYGWGNGDPSGNVADETAAKRFTNLKFWMGYSDGYTYTSPVGTFRANILGLHDMSGNVLEWCADSYYTYTKHDKTNPRVTSTGEFRVLRGGSWINGQSAVRTTTRNKLHHTYRGSRVGFRVVQQIKN